MEFHICQTSKKMLNSKNTMQVIKMLVFLLEHITINMQTKLAKAKKRAENCLKYIEGKDFDLPIFYDVEDGSLNGLSKRNF